MAADERARKMAMYEQFARAGKALANPARLELLDLLAQGERSVEELAQAGAMKVSNTSAQLRALAGAGLVASRRDGVRIYYRLADQNVSAFVGRVQDFAASRLADAEQAARSYLGDVAALEPVARDELARRLHDGQVLVLDVRPGAEYAAGHIPGAVSMPHDQLAARLAELPQDADIVAYCRGRYCVFAPDAVRLLRARGFSARPLAGGLPDWRHAGLPVTTGASARPVPCTPSAPRPAARRPARRAPPPPPLPPLPGSTAACRPARETAGNQPRCRRPGCRGGGRVAAASREGLRTGLGVPAREPAARGAPSAAPARGRRAARVPARPGR